MADALKLTYACLMGVSSVACVSGNLLLLMVLILNHDLRSDAWGLTVSCSISDLALGLSVLPLAAHNSLSAPPAVLSDAVFCQGSGFLFLLLQTCSVHSLTWTTVDKFTEIRFALSYRSIWTRGRSWAVLVLVWFFGLLSAALPLLGFGSYTYSHSRFLCCLSFVPDNRKFVVTWAALGVLVPCTATCSLYAAIVCVARQQARRGTFVCNEQHCFYVPANSYLRSSIVMVTHSVCVLLCWLPYVSVCLYETLSGEQSLAVTSALCTWLSLSSGAMTPWITCMTQTRYRAAARRTLLMFICKLLRPRPQISALPVQPTNHQSVISTMTTPPAAAVKTVTPTLS